MQHHRGHRGKGRLTDGRRYRLVYETAPTDRRIGVKWSRLQVTRRPATTAQSPTTNA